MTTFTKRSGIGLVSVLAFVLAACGGSGSGIDDQSQLTPNQPGQPGQPGQPPAPTQPPAADTGYLNLSVSDAPIKDAAKVCIRFDGVELKHADSGDKETIDFDEPEVVNLLLNQGANSHPIITGWEVPAGEYEWIRLKVQAERGMSGGVNDADPTSELCDDQTENSYLVRKNGDLNNLYIPSGSQRGLQLIKDIIIAANRTGDYTAEWDLGKSFNSPPGQLPDVMMKPVVKLVANNEVGTLVGQVGNELIALESCDADFPPSVYVFDDGVTPNPFDDPFAEDDAVATGLVEERMLEDGSMQYRYSIGFLLAGNYEAAYTCNGTDFIPLAGKPAEIFVEEVTTVDFFLEDAPGTLTGQVADAFFDPEAPESGLCDAEFDAAVYVFAEDVAPDFAEAPLEIVDVAMDMTAEQYRYSVALQAGNYNAAFTCTGTEFIPVDGKTAEIFPATETIVDFLTEDAPAPVGSMSGSVASELVDACAETDTPSISVFAGTVTPSSDLTPDYTGEVIGEEQTDESILYSYSIDLITAGTYTAAFTCDGSAFEPTEGLEAVINIGEETPLDFVAPPAE
ncbi:MAG: DUF4382 domain-containing protein [Woeseiaceae bacterium]|jgi:hypothetical protein|nr:DUF4382 domain-containing protein [Woeseiaceae bacterium]